MATNKKKTAAAKPKRSPRSPAAVKPKPPAPILSATDPATDPAPTLAADPVFDPTADPAAAWEPSKAIEVLLRIRPRWPSLSTDEIVAFDTLSTDAQRSALGVRTKARGVAADAVRWAGLIDRQLREYAVLREHYAPKRFSYYLHRLDALIQELDKLGNRKSAQGDAGLGTQTASAAARAARKKLVRAMERFAGRREADEALLSEARGETTSDAFLVSSIKTLVALAVRWVATGSPTLLEAANLTSGLLDEVRAAANALASAGASVTEVGTAPKRDTPAINFVEGWVLEEMLRVHEDVDAAREESPILERLIPSAATRAIFGGRAAKQAAPAPAVAVAPAAVAAPPAPAAVPADIAVAAAAVVAKQ